MAQIHGVAGEWARVKGTVVGLWPLFLGMFACGFFIAMAIFAMPRIGACGVVIVLVAMAFSLMRGLRRVERFYKGARGEERVSGILKGLPDGYHVFNDFVAGSSHVDHVVVGPAGIFSLETKFWRGAVTIEDGQILVDGRLPSRLPLPQARKEAGDVAARLEKLGWRGAVTPVLVFASDTFAPGIAETGGVVVINSNEVAAAFGTKSVQLSSDEISRLVSFMENNL